MRRIRKIVVYAVAAILIIVGILLLLAHRPVPDRITYGASFNTLYARELGLDWKEVYLATLEDLGVRHLRLAAHWSMIEPTQDTFNFSELDFQLTEAEARGAEVIFSVGRRLPRWPECHVPEWAEELSWDKQKQEIREMITEVVRRYKDRGVITHWQVENEPYLEVFAIERCGELDEDFLKEEISLVRELDPSRPILVTDSGNLGLWKDAYRAGDVFGTSLYLYFWNPDIGPFKSVLPPAYYRLKYNLMETLFGEKPSYLIELSAEPWLLEPVVAVPLETQLERMNAEKFDDIIQFARETGFDRQYLWGVEWWYWLTFHGHNEFWESGKQLFTQ